MFRSASCIDATPQQAAQQLHPDRDRGQRARAPTTPRQPGSVCSAAFARLHDETVAHYRALAERTTRDRHADRTARHRVLVGEDRHRQGDRDQSPARHRPRRRLPDVRRERAAGIRLVLRTGRALDGPRLDVDRRFRHRAHGARVPARSSSATTGRSRTRSRRARR